MMMPTMLRKLRDVFGCDLHQSSVSQAIKCFDEDYATFAGVVGSDALLEKEAKWPGTDVRGDDGAHPFAQ
jgi:hypothetical protein